VLDIADIVRDGDFSPTTGIRLAVYVPAGCTMNTGAKKLQREVGSIFCGAQHT
jgi:hypothetical protein